MPRAPLLQGDEKRRAVRHMFDAIADRYEMVNKIMSFGLDRRWRRRCLEALDLPPGSLVLDVACGTGDLYRALKREGCSAVGLDLSLGMLLAGKSAAQKGTGGRPTAPLLLGDALASPFADAAFDGAVSGFALRNVTDLGALFVELGRIVRPGGRVSLLDLCEPAGPVLRQGHRLWAGKAVPLIGSWLSDPAAYRYLPRSLAYLPPSEIMVRLLEEAGFRAVQYEPLTGGVAQLYVATRAGGAN